MRATPLAILPGHEVLQRPACSCWVLAKMGAWLPFISPLVADLRRSIVAGHAAFGNQNDGQPICLEGQSLARL